MRLTRKQKRQIVVGIAIVLILYGILDKLFQFNIDKKVIDNVSLVLMVLAFGLLFSRSNDKKEDTAGTEQAFPSTDPDSRGDKEEEISGAEQQLPPSEDPDSREDKEELSGAEQQLPPSEDPESLLEQTALENDLVKDQDKGSTNNDETRNDLRS